MKLHRLFTAAIVIVLLVGTVSLPVAAEQVDAKGKIESLVLEELSTDGQTDFFVWMVAKADLSQANQFHSKLEKGKFVLNALRQTAERSQQGLRRYLDQQGVSYEAFYIANKILVRGGDLTMVNSLAARPDVAQISANHIYQLQEPYEDSPAPDDILAVGSNITFIKAPSAWSLGYTGQGTVLAGNDTGLDETHPAIARHYRGCQNPPTCTSWEHNYNWWDATGTYRTNPADGHGHGTHTTGTMVGDDGGTNQIGVAPGAQTIHCKNMTDSGSGSDATFTTCFQWDLAPWDLNGQNANPAMAPDAINNSWGYSGGNNPIFRDEIQALHAAGILVEVSAGNEGPGCATLRSPSDYWEVLTTGSVNHAVAFPGSMTSFSSRGPSDLDGNYFPDITAPGESIRSSVPGGTYENWSGTSMAGPHATALVGLMWSACPSLQGNVYQTIGIIQQTAVPVNYAGSCGGDYVKGPNNDWGYGTIDALAAVQQAYAQCVATGTLQGTVIDSETNSPVAGATITAEWASGGSWTTTTDASGFYQLTVPFGLYTVTASLTGYASQTVYAVQVNEGATTVQDFALDPVELSVHVNAITLSYTTRGKNRTLKSLVTIFDQDNLAAPSASVSGQWTLPNGTKVNQNATTTTAGVATFSYSTKTTGTYQFCVTNVVKTGYIYILGLTCNTIIVK